MFHCFVHIDSSSYVYLTREEELMAYDAENNETILLMDNFTFVSSTTV